MSLTTEKSVSLLLHKDGKELFKIDGEGVISYRLNGELKTMESEKELSLIFSIVISEMAGISLNKEEIINKVIENWRNGKIDNLLGN